MLKTAVYDIFMKTVGFPPDSLMIRKFRREAFDWNKLFCNIIYVFCNFFINLSNASLLNKNIDFLKKNTDPKPLNSSVIITYL